MFTFVFSDLSKSTNLDTHIKDALKSISSIGKSSISIQLKANKSTHCCFLAWQKTSNQNAENFEI